jgi:GNAT superfamily N-acetyltransferase
MVFRDAGSFDADAIAALHALSWRRSYRDILRCEFLDGFVEDERRGVWRSRLSAAADNPWVRLAVEGTALIGFVCVFPDRDERWGSLVDNLHVHPDRKGQGIGRQLLGQAAGWAAAHARSSVLHLWVYEENRSARAFYDRCGGAAVETVVRRSPDGGDYPEVRYAWIDLAALARRGAANIA